MSYEGRGVDELQAFCKARGLPTKATTASRLVRILVKADDAATFPRFFDLPAEIRNMIYELFFRDLKSFGNKHVQPPLTLASRQLRAEGLPLFYECATFDLFAQTARRMGPSKETVEMSSCIKSLLYMPAANFKRIKKFNLFWSRFPCKRKSDYAKQVVQIALYLAHENVPEDPEDYYCQRLDDEIEYQLDNNFWSLQDTLRDQEHGTKALEIHTKGSLVNDMEGTSNLGDDHSKPGILMLRTIID
jgi:hypothetical protein